MLSKNVKNSVFLIVLLFIFAFSACDDYQILVNPSTYLYVDVSISNEKGFLIEDDSSRMKEFGMNAESARSDRVGQLSWKGRSFSLSFSDEARVSSYTYRMDIEISGTVSRSFNQLIDFQATRHYSYSYASGEIKNYSSHLSLHDLTLCKSSSETNKETYECLMTGGSEIAFHIDSISWQNEHYIGGQTNNRILAPIDWDDETIMLSVSFYQ